MSKDILDNLEQLSPEELQKVANLINKFAGRKDSKIDKKPKAGKIGHGPGRRTSKKSIVVPGEDDPPPRKQARGKRGRRESSRLQKKTKSPIRRKGGKKGVAARIEPVQLSGQNKFDKMRERNTVNDDRKTDALLWENKEPSPRPDTFEFSEVQCQECGYYFDIHPDLVYVDRDSKEVVFTCDDCSPRGH